MHLQSPFPPLILASASAYRKELLERLRIPFTASPADIDEHVHDALAPGARVAQLARDKAETVFQPGNVVIGSDQLACLGDRVLGKPGGFEAAAEQLHLCSGQAVTFLTAIAVLNTQGQLSGHHVDTTEVRFRSLDDATIERYLTAEAPFDCAGSFKAEGLGITLFKSLTSRDPTAIVGLPLIALSGLLRDAGYALP